MDGGALLVFGLIAYVLNFLLMAIVIRHAIDQSKLTKRISDLTDEVRKLRRELAKEKPQVIDKRV